MAQRILIVDDDPVTAKLVAAVLRRAGYEVVIVYDALQAFGVLETIPPDLLILDVVMPGMNGYEFCRMLRADRSRRQLPVLMFTGMARPADQRRGFQMGADDYVVKPVNARELVDRVRSLLYFAAQVGAEHTVAVPAPRAEVAQETPRGRKSK
jgi:DNA-binding response OmpR family regulator